MLVEQRGSGLDLMERPFKATAAKAEVSLSRENEDSIRSLTDLLAEALDPIAELNF